MADPLIAQLDQKGVKQALKDIKQLLRIHYQLEKEYARGQSDVQTFMKKYEHLIKLASKKYKGLFFKLKKSADALTLRIFIKKEKNLKDVFINGASKIPGLKSIGTKNLGEVDITKNEDFNKKLDSAKENLYVSYQTPEFGVQTLLLHYDAHQKMPEMLYEMEAILDDKTPDFKLFVYYALVDGYDQKIDIFKLGAEIGMADLMYYPERMDFLEKFDPRLLE